MLIPVVLCGGSGSRLWPVSRAMHPKPFMQLPDGETLLEKTFARAAALPGAGAVIAVTNREYFFQTRDEYLKARTALELFSLLEPVGRNTAPAVAMAALFALERFGGDAVLMVMPSDHLVSPQTAFDTAVAQAARLANAGNLVAFGLRPRFPETGYGYIETEATPFPSGGFRVKRFAEKPSYDQAQAYVESGRYYWNSGMFCFKASLFMEELGTHDPALRDASEASWRAAAAASARAESPAHAVELDAATFAKLTDISVDYAIMEKSGRIAMVEAQFEWNDIGSWASMSELIPPDSAGNRLDGDGLLLDTRNTFVQSRDRLVAAIGVDNLMIVDTPDALLVADRDRAQDVKAVTEQLKLKGHETHRLHRTVHRPWGTYTVLQDSERYKIKRIEVRPGGSLSLQMHRHRSEHWVVVSGTAQVTNGEKTLTLNPNESTYIPAGHKHRLENPGRVPLAIIEVQCGDYLGEDDIVRFDDKYGRRG